MRNFEPLKISNLHQKHSISPFFSGTFSDARSFILETNSFSFVSIQTDHPTNCFFKIELKIAINSSVELILPIRLPYGGLVNTNPLSKFGRVRVCSDLTFQEIFSAKGSGRALEAFFFALSILSSEISNPKSDGYVCEFSLHVCHTFSAFEYMSFVLTLPKGEDSANNSYEKTLFFDKIKFYFPKKNQTQIKALMFQLCKK